MTKAVFFDVDGTLLSHVSRSVPQSARDGMAKLKQAGIHCVVATGRQLQEMLKLPVGDLDFDGFITMNGQLLLDKGKRILWENPLSEDALQVLLKLFDARQVPILLVTRDRMYINYIDDQVIQTQAAISSGLPMVDVYRGEPIYQACIYIAREREYLVQEALDLCQVNRWHSGGLDLVSKDSGKVVGIRQYLESQGFAREESMAFGDGDNDVQMLRFVGIGVAMGNAVPEAKEAADYVTADIDDDGIAKALEHFGLI